jgi:SAM-dependent methyltransferase
MGAATRRLRAAMEPALAGVPEDLHRDWPKRNRRSPPITSATYLTLTALVESLIRARDRYLESGITILDIGCGEMPYYPVFATVAADYAGADLGPGPQVRYVCPAEALTAPDQSFDAVLSTQLLEHALDPARCVAEMRRVLKPGGVALVTTHGVWPYHPVPNDYWRWTHEGLRKLTQDNGLEVLEIVPHRSSWSTLASLAALSVSELTRGRTPLVGRLTAAVIASLNLAGIAGDRVSTRLAFPREHSLILNYLVIARRAKDDDEASGPMPAAT